MEHNLNPISIIRKEPFTPKKINVRSGTTNSGNEYERKVTLFLALRCFFQKLYHFWICTNLDGFCDLDDIVLFMQRTETDEGVTYILQVKHQDEPKNIVRDMLLDDKGNFSLKKYSESYNKLQSKENDKQQTAGLIEYLRQREMLFFVFTNKGVFDNVKFLHPVNIESPLLDIIGRNGNSFRIDFDALKSEAGVNIEFLKNLYLCTKQPNVKDMNREIKNIIKEHVCYIQLTDAELTEIVRLFVEFIDAWAHGFLCGRFVLTKEHISKKLAELLLLPYMFKLKEDSKEETVGTGEENAEEDLWYHITEDKDVTIIDGSDDETQEYLSNNINKIICMRGLLWNSINRKLLRVVGDPKHLTKCEKYEVLWKTNKIPLLLEVTKEQDVLHVQEILTRFPKAFRVIIMNKTFTHFNTFEGLKSFINLSDLCIEHQKAILKKPIKLQGRVASIENLNIGNVQLFKVKDIVEILCGVFHIGNEFEQLPVCFVEMSLTRNIFNIRLLKEIEEDIFSIWINSPKNNFESILIERYNIDAKEISSPKNRWFPWKRKTDPPYRFIIHNDKNFQKFGEISATWKKPVHFMIWHGDDDLEWIRSNNTKYDLKVSQKMEDQSISAKYLLKDFYQTRKTLLVSSNPGMGKSVLMNYFAQNLPEEVLVLNVTLAKYKHYQNWDPENVKLDEFPIHFQTFLKEVVKEKQTLETTIFQFVFNQCLNSKNIVFLLDGLDEVPVNLQKGAIELIKYITNSGFHTCVTTRPILEKELQSALFTSVVKLNMFTPREQKSFLTNYFTNIANVVLLNQTKVDVFVTELLKATKLNLNDMDNRFTGIPLQATLLAEVFADDFKKYLEEGIFKNRYFDLLYLYEHFIKQKINLAFSKVESVSKDMIYQYKTCRAFYALRHLFEEQDLEELKIIEKLRVIHEMLQHTTQLIQKDGIVVTDSDSNVSFVHQTYAEFLVADWLAENINTIHKEIAKKLITKTFRPNFLVVRNMFDRMLAKDCPLHTAIVNRQINMVKTLIASEENAFSTTDKGGRTVLHLIAAWGIHHSDIRNKIDKKMVREDVMMAVLNEIPNDKLNLVEDKLLNCTPLDYAILSRSLHIANRLSLTVQNPKCCVDIIKEEADCMLRYIDEYYSASLYMVIFRGLMRTDLVISEGDEAKIKSCISKKNINKADRNGCTPLHIASKSGDHDIVDLLLSKNAEVNAIDRLGRSALHWASYLGHLNIIGLLLRKGALINITDSYGLTPLHYLILGSSSNNQTDTILLLLTIKESRYSGIANTLHTVFKIPKTILNIFKKPNHCVNLKDKENYMSPLHIAAHFGQTDVLTLLLTQNIDINTKGWRGMTALMFAAKNNQIDSVNFLLTNAAKRDIKDDSNRTALHYSAKHGHSQVATLLLNNNADLEAIDDSNQTSLHLAVLNGHKEVVNALLASGAKIDAKSSDNRTPLHMAALYGHSHVITVLLLENADIEAQTIDNETPLHLAASYGQVNATNVLLNNKANVEARNLNNETSLHLAVRNGNCDVLTVLLTNGANIEVKNFANETPLHLAVCENQHDVVTALLTSGADIEARNYYKESPLHLAVRLCNEDIVTILLNNGADIEARNAYHETALHLAAAHGHRHLVELLLSKGASIKTVNYHNETPLHLAVCEDREDVIKVLLSNGADTEAKDANDRTPFHVARLGSNALN